MLPLRFRRFARSVDIPCHSSCCWEQLDLAVVDLCPPQLTMYPTLGIECETSGQSFDLNVGCAILQSRRYPIRVEPEGEQAVAARPAAVRICGLQCIAYRIGELAA